MSAWYGLHLPLESIELAMVFFVYVAVLAAVYYLQRWIGDY